MQNSKTCPELVEGSEIKTKKAYTLIELLVVLALVGGATFFLIPITFSQFSKKKLSNVVQDVSSLISANQIAAYTGKNSTGYGIKFFSGGYYVYTGNTYATATSIDTVNLDTNMSFNSISLTGGTTEVDFTTGSLKPSANGYIRVTDSVNTYEIDINAQGFIDYQQV